MHILGLPWRFKLLKRQFSSTNIFKMTRKLAAFDFDHTILDDNSDTAVFTLTDKSEIPQDIKKIQFTNGWTAFMQGVFTFLHKQGVTSGTIKTLIKDLPPVSGMLNLIETLHKHPDYDLIIISDSNSIFIEVWLENQGIEKYFLQVFTNPAKIVDDMFKISPYHDQKSCKLSTPNLCKGQILEEFVASQKEKGVTYDKVVYIGDGVNDFCPVLRLDHTDLACARNTYKLKELLEKAKNGTSLDNSGNRHILKPEVFVWSSGDDIINRLELKQ